jgi:hypothetical protein
VTVLRAGRWVVESDPKKLLQGSGKTVRHVVLNSCGLRPREIEGLMAAALKLAKVPRCERQGPVIISGAQKQRASREESSVTGLYASDGESPALTSKRLVQGGGDRSLPTCIVPFGNVTCPNTTSAPFVPSARARPTSRSPLLRCCFHDAPSRELGSDYLQAKKLLFLRPPTRPVGRQDLAIRLDRTFTPGRQMDSDRARN